MRNLIIGLTVIFFALSGIILIKALNIPVDHVQLQDDPDGLKANASAAETGDNPGEALGDQASSRSAGQGLQAAAAPSGYEGPDRKAGQQAYASGNGNNSRVLAVIGAGAFNSGQVIVDDRQMSAIKEVVHDVLSLRDYRLYVEGHTDDMPINTSSDKQYINNMELSLLRAKAVASILVENGISPDRISVTGYGDTRPAASNETDEGRINNRRVEIKLVSGDKEL